VTQTLDTNNYRPTSILFEYTAVIGSRGPRIE